MRTENLGQDNVELEDGRAILAEVHEVRSRRPSRVFVRLFAVFATIVMVLTVFGILARPASGASAAPPNQSPVRALSGPGVSVVSSAGATAVAFQETFQRWDGVFEPLSALNLSTDDWPYLLRQDASSFTFTRLGSNFTQAKIPGAVYDFEPGAIKETIVLSGRSDAPFDAIGVGIRGSYLPLAHGAQVDLLDRDGNSVWESEPFTAHDSSPVPQEYANPVQSVAWSPGGLTLHLDPEMLTWAQYPLYLDPTWVIRGTTAGGWSGSLDAVTNDRGDANLRLGVLADNFNDNVNEIWTVTSGNSFSLSGGRASLKATEVHAAGSWSNLTLGATVNFASCGASKLMFRYVTSSNYYYLYVNFASQQVTLYKVINGVTTALSSTLSIPMSANTNYDVKVVGRGNAFEIWWASAKKWSGSDPSPPGSPLTGNVGISETTSGCILYLDNVRARDPAKWSGNYTSVKRGAASGSVATQVRFLGTADSYNVTDLWVNSSSDNTTWGGWHLVKTMAAPGSYWAIPDVDLKRYYQIRAVLRSYVDGTPALREVDVSEGSPPTVVAHTNTGHAPWYPYVGGEVNAISGNLFLAMPGLSIPAKGDSISVVPHYNSLLASTPGPFGLGTMDEFHGSLAFAAGGNVTLTAGDGAVYTFVTMGGSAFSPPPGIHDNLVKNADATYTLWQPDGSRANFDATGKLTVLLDRNGNHRTLTYTNGNPTRIADDSGLALTLVYDAGNRVTSITDPIGRKVTYAYDGSGRLTNITDPMGYMENVTYDASGRPNRSVDPAGHLDRFAYDGNGRVSQMWIGEWSFATSSIRWQVEEYAVTYTSGSQTAVRNAQNILTTITLNSAGNPTNILGPNVGCSLCSAGNSTTYTWDGEFDRLAFTDGRNQTTTYTYDWMGNTLSSTDPGGNQSLRAYMNVQNNTQFITLLTGSTTPRGFTTRYAYYWNGNPFSTTEPGNVNVSYRFYDAAGSLTRVQDFRGNSITYGYDTHEFRINTSDAGGNRTAYQNDGIGRTWNVTSPGGNVTRKVLDLDSRVTSITDPMGNTTRYVFDPEGRTIKVTDPNSLVTMTSYNLTFGGAQTTVSRGGNTTQFVYDNLGDRIRIVDPNNHATLYAYDSFRRMANSTTPLGQVTRYTYDGAGNLASKTDPNGTLVRYAYDRSNRELRVTYPGGAPQTTAYDQDGNVIEKRAFVLDDSYFYDALDQVIQTRQIFLDTNLTIWHNYTYDANGNRRSMDGVGGGSYTWDKNNRISSEIDAVGNRWAFVYGKDGQLLKETYPDGEYVTYAYDRNGRLTLDIAYRPNGTVLEKLGYLYDKVGNIVTKQTPQTPTGLSTWYNSGCCASLTDNLTASGLQPSPQTVTLSVSATGSWIGGEPGIPDTAFVTWYYVLNGVATILGTRSYTLTGQPVGFTATFSASVSVRNADVLAGEISCTSNQGSQETTTSVSVSYVGSTNPTTYVYDMEYRLSRATYPNGTAGTYTYDAVGNRLTYTLGGTTVASSYNADSELTSSTDGASYTYDSNGNRLTWTQGSLTTHYAYDYANDLAPLSTTQAVAGSCTQCGSTPNETLLVLLPSPQSKTLTVTGSGTLTDDVDYPNCPAVTVTWNYVLNSVHHALGSQVIQLIPNNRFFFCHAVFSGSYSSASPVALHSADRLAGEVTVNVGSYSVSVSYSSTSLDGGTVNVAPYAVLKYGPDGIWAEETVNLGTSATHYGYDLLGMGRLPQRVAEFAGTTLTRSYFYGVGSDRPLDIIQGAAGYFYHRDLLGSTTTVTDGSGNVAASYKYDAYGNLFQSADTIGNPLRFTGLASDATLGLMYARTRYYDSATGSFLTPDPITCRAGPTCGCYVANKYVYAADNPVNLKDPSGRWAVSSHLFDGIGGDVNDDLATGVGTHGPRWMIWYRPSPNPAATQAVADYGCDALWGLVGLAVCGGPEDIFSIGCAVFFAVVGGAVCAAVDAYFFHKPLDLKSVSCQDIAGEICSESFEAKGLGVLGALACPIFAGLWCDANGA